MLFYDEDVEDRDEDVEYFSGNEILIAGSLVYLWSCGSTCTHVCTCIRWTMVWVRVSSLFGHSAVHVSVAHRQCQA